MIIYVKKRVIKMQNKPIWKILAKNATENGDVSDYGIKWDGEEIFARQTGWDVEILMEEKRNGNRLP